MGNPYDPRPYQGGPGQPPNAGFGPAGGPAGAGDVTQLGPLAQPQDPYGQQGPYGPPPAGPVGPPGQYGQPQGGPYGPPQGGPGWGQPYGPPQRSFNLAAMDLTKVAAGVVVLSGLVVLICSLFSLYTITVTPSAADVPNNDAPSGDISVGIGFYDVLPVLPPPIVAQAIPVLLLLAALSAAPLLYTAEKKTAPLAAVFAGTGALLALILTISSPLPSVELTGELAEQLEDEVGGQTVEQLVDSVASVGPGAGLIIALIFGLIGWAAAVFLTINRKQSAAPAPGGPQLPPSAPPAGPPAQGW